MNIFVNEDIVAKRGLGIENGVINHKYFYQPRVRISDILNGDLAQMVERYICTVKAIGSTPIISNAEKICNILQIYL